MKRSDRRRYQSQLKKIIKKSGENCSVCDRIFHDKELTFGGITHRGDVALSGECCRDQLTTIFGAGIYTVDHLGLTTGSVHWSDQSPSSFITVEDIARSAMSLKLELEKTEMYSSAAITNAGLDGFVRSISIVNSLWKADDANWFIKNPTRYYRIRAIYPGEDAELPIDVSNSNGDADYCWEVVVRQILKGQRVRAAFYRPRIVEIPDLDSVLDELFQLLCQPRLQGVISSEKLSDLLVRHREV